MPVGIGLDREAAAREQQVCAGSRRGMLPPESDRTAGSGGAIESSAPVRSPVTGQLFSRGTFQCFLG